jgi:hypothetical protein
MLACVTTNILHFKENVDPAGFLHFQTMCVKICWNQSQITTRLLDNNLQVGEN